MKVCAYSYDVCHVCVPFSATSANRASSWPYMSGCGANFSVISCLWRVMLSFPRVSIFICHPRVQGRSVSGVCRAAGREAAIFILQVG